MNSYIWEYHNTNPKVHGIPLLMKMELLYV